MRSNYIFRHAGCMLLFLILHSASFADEPLPMPVGRVIWVQGHLVATMKNNEERSLQKSSIIYLHDTLATDPKSRAQIIFSDQTLMTLRPGTTFYINQYDFHPDKDKGSVGKYVIDLLRGGFRTITGLIARYNPSDYKVNTPLASIGVRGTDYSVVYQNGRLKMANHAGTPCIQTHTHANLCLNNREIYALVANDGKPIVLNIPPDEFKEKLPIVPAHFTAFTYLPTAMPNAYHPCLGHK